MNKLNVLDLFCGAGGFTIGFEMEGFKSVLAIDKWSLTTLKKHQRKEQNQNYV